MAMQHSRVRDIQQRLRQASSKPFECVRRTERLVGHLGKPHPTCWTGLTQSCRTDAVCRPTVSCGIGWDIDILQQIISGARVEQ